MSGDFKETGAFAPSFSPSPNPNRMWLKRTTASALTTPAAKQIASRRATVILPCITCKSCSVTFKSCAVIFNPVHLFYFYTLKYIRLPGRKLKVLARPDLSWGRGQHDSDFTKA